MLLRREYKRIFRQVNIAKHIKTVFASTSFGKLAFAVALGPYESEAWFANCWYQKRETRNELLIEALMGKTNAEIRKIKEGFKDAKYENSLIQAVRNELVANKFRMAVLIQLEGVRMEELSPGLRFNVDEIKNDVRRLGEILERKDGRGGGETQMIEIIINRSDGWIKEIAAMYRNVYRRDLPKVIMNHSKNLVVSLFHPFGIPPRKYLSRKLTASPFPLNHRVKHYCTLSTGRSISPSETQNSSNKPSPHW